MKTHIKYLRTNFIMLAATFSLVFFFYSSAHAQSCTTLFPSGSQTPGGYGASWNVFSTAKELLLSGTCSGDKVDVIIGSDQPNQYVFNQGFYWNGTQWRQLSLTGANPPAGTWLARQGKATFAKGTQDPAIFVGYVCQYTNNAWKCGCADSACTTPRWQVQALQTETSGGDFSGSGPSAPKRSGAKNGVSFWTLPNTPNGMKPSQTWGGAGVTPSGDVYVGGMDHKTNSALYRLHNDRLYYVGDAKSASQQANNWQSNEVAEKFHTRPTWLNGSMYVATMNASELNNNYLSKRGFHWYGYNIAGDAFTDLSAPGVSADHGSIVTLAPDEKRNILYGAMHPTGDIYAYYPDQKKSVKLGRPAYGGRKLVYPGRFMWVDQSTGILYFTAGNDAIPYYGGSYDPAIFNHVYFYEPGKGFGEKKDWKLNNQRAIDAGQCQNGVCYLMDNKGHIYRFTESGSTWTYVGQVTNLPPSSTTDITWVFSVDFSKQLAYIVVSSPTTLYEFNLQTGASVNLGSLESHEPELKKYSVLYGHNAWSKGVFYFAALGTDPNLNLTLVGIDPTKFKQAIGK